MFDSLFARRGVSLDRLRALVEIYDAGNIAKAAPGNPVRNSQYSRQLRELSEYFGCELATRNGKMIRLTAVAIRLAQSSREFLSQLEDFEAECRSGQVAYSIAAGDSLVHWLIVPRIAPIVDALPTVRLGTQSFRTQEIVEYVRNGRIDLGLVRSTAERRGLRSHVLGKLTYSVVIPKAMCGGKSPPSIRDAFRDYPMAMQISEGEFTRNLETIAKRASSRFRPALACQSLPQVATAVKSRRFAAVLPDIALGDMPPNTIHCLSGYELKKLEREIVLVWSERMTGVRPLGVKLVEACTSALLF